MQITGISFEKFENIINTLNATKYAENNIVVSNPRILSGNRFSVKIDMSDSRAPGSRRTHSGRHGKYASWWTFYDIMAGVFHANESARISAGKTVYRGSKDFDNQTYYGPQDNIGSVMFPAYHEDVAVDLDFDHNTFRWEAFSRGEDWNTYTN